MRRARAEGTRRGDKERKPDEEGAREVDEKRG